MAEAATPYPLQWPSSRRRTPAAQRKTGKFNRKERVGSNSWLSTKELTVADALRRLQNEIERIGARYPVVSTNLETRVDGLPRSGQRSPDDPGVALYFQLAGKPHCLPCDTYNRVADNIAAIAAHIEATRAIERHGVASVAEMFSGFVALPPPRGWANILGFGHGDAVTIDKIEAHYRRLAKERHPDSGGSDALMAELNRARDDAKRELAAAG